MLDFLTLQSKHWPMPTDGNLGRILEGARRRAQLSQDELWLRYCDAGGVTGRSAFIGYLRGITEPLVTQYNIMASVLNEELRRKRSRPLLPELRFENMLDQVK